MSRKISPLLLAVVLIAVVLSLVLIMMGIPDYLNNNATGSLYITMGLTILAISAYMLFQSRKRVFKMGFETQPLTTTLLCQKCGFKNIREFQNSDYIFKHTDEACPKCKEKAIVISAIYREVKEKEKTREEI